MTLELMLQGHVVLVLIGGGEFMENVYCEQIMHGLKNIFLYKKKINFKMFLFGSGGVA